MTSVVHVKPKTRRGYESLLQLHILPRFGALPLARLEPLDVKEWVAGLTSRGMSASQARQAYRLLAAMLASAVESRYIARTPCVGVKLPRLPKVEMHFLTADQVDVLAAAMERVEDALLVVLFAYTGLRWGEAAALRRGRCGLGRLKVAETAVELGGELLYGPPKTHEERHVVLPAFLRDLLAKHLENVPNVPDALVFSAERGGPLRHSNWWHRVWAPTVARVPGLPDGLRIHDLRHTCASLLIGQGANVKAVQRQLGHASAAMTLDRYAHLFPDEQDRLAEALDAVWNGRGAGRDAGPMRDGDGTEVIELPARRADNGR